MAIGSDITLTAEQLESVNYNAGDLLIRGVAGSGKSVVLMSRALHLNKKANEAGDNVRILILTYTKTLVQYTKKLVSLAGLSPCRIELNGIDALIYSCCRDLGIGYIQIANDEQRESYASMALMQHMEKSANKKHRFYTIDPQFWMEEFDWMAQKAIRSKEEYINAERTGRGGKIRLNKDDRLIVYEIFEIYQQILASKGKKTFEDLYQYAWDNRKRIPKKYLYDYVLIDEAQDLSFVQLRIARYLAGKAITIAADNAQKIYNKSFAWKDIGIDIRGRASKKLSVSFRNTKEIWLLAEGLQNVNRYYKDDSTEYTESDSPSISGTKPRVFKCKNAADENYLITTLARKWASEGITAGILYRSGVDGRSIMNLLRQERIPFEVVKKGEEWDITRPGIKFCTMHSSKGLEFDAVLVPHFNSSSVPPGYLLSDSDEDQRNEILRTERSLLYVAMTRAKTSLTLSFCGFPSLFLSELYPECYDFLGTNGQPLEKVAFTGIREDQIKKTMPSNTPDKPRPAVPSAPVPASAQRVATASDIAVGANVLHNAFGKGVISKVTSGLFGQSFKIKFDDGSERSFVTKKVIEGGFLKVLK